MQENGNTYTSKTDEELALLCLRRDQLAFGELMQRHIISIHRFALQYAQSSEDADDIVQDGFFKAWKHIKSFKPEKKFKTWLYAIIRNTALDQIKKKRSVPFSTLDDVENDTEFEETLQDTEPLAPELFERTEVEQEVTTALADLHPDHRNIILMHYRDHMTFEEIATIVHLPMNTIKSWHHRAIKRLKTRLSLKSAPK